MTGPFLLDLFCLWWALSVGLGFSHNKCMFPFYYFNISSTPADVIQYIICTKMKNITIVNSTKFRFTAFISRNTESGYTAKYFIIPSRIRLKYQLWHLTKSKGLAQTIISSVFHEPYCTANPVNTKRLYNICTMLVQRRRRWADVVQMLYKCFVFAGNNVITSAHETVNQCLFNAEPAL